ncbi:MAG: hypothetical protein HY727_17395 [Candidatus Rokubacteria bacterium]|nr:hypothetical protein [Candidatus Rokubacteria bacterium]
MHAHAVTYDALRRSRRRAFFLTRTTQQVKSLTLLREILRAAVALGGLIAWGGLAVLLAG